MARSKPEKADTLLIMTALASIVKNMRLKNRLLERIREIEDEINPPFYPDM
jgi:hypothetical protein